MAPSLVEGPSQRLSQRCVHKHPKRIVFIILDLPDLRQLASVLCSGTCPPGDGKKDAATEASLKS